MKLDGLWTDYMRETYGREVVYAYTKDGVGGFAAYEFQDEGRDCYIADIYVRPDQRKKGVGAGLFHEIRHRARVAGARRILGTIDVTRAGWRESIAAQEAVGFVLAGHNDRGQALLVYTLGG